MVHRHPTIWEGAVQGNGHGLEPTRRDESRVSSACVDVGPTSLPIGTGHKKAVIAVAHAILVVAYHLLTRETPYHDLGATTTTGATSSKPSAAPSPTLERQGYRVTVEAVA
jgi:hypothetical protein